MEDIQLQIRRIVNAILAPTTTGELAALPLHALRCLHAVAHREMAKVAELAHDLAVTVSAASMMVDRLRRMGLVERLPDLADRRVVRVMTTERARKLLQDARDTRRQHLAEVLSRLSAPDRRHIAEGVRLLANAAELCRELPTMDSPTEYSDSIFDAFLPHRARLRHSQCEAPDGA